jgi:hypothetical protein
MSFLDLRPLIPVFQIIEERLRRHHNTPHECGSMFLCKILAGRDLENETEHKETVNLLFEALYVFIHSSIALEVMLNVEKLCSRYGSGSESELYHLQSGNSSMHMSEAV